MMYTVRHVENPNDVTAEPETVYVGWSKTAAHQAAAKALGYGSLRGLLSSFGDRGICYYGRAIGSREPAYVEIF